MDRYRYTDGRIENIRRLINQNLAEHLPKLQVATREYTARRNLIPIFLGKEVMDYSSDLYYHVGKLYDYVSNLHIEEEFKKPEYNSSKAKREKVVKEFDSYFQRKDVE
jgi:hypothetical protein